MDLFVSAIHTDSGKTLVSALLCEALGADYWKPIQSGQPYDRDTVAELIDEPEQRIHPSSYTFSHPVSPHQAAEMEQREIETALIKKPKTEKPLIIEGAGGLMVPLTPRFYMVDLIKKLQIPVILVSNYYLGSINHTLLSLELIRHLQIPLKGIIFNGKENTYSRKAILDHTPTPVLLSIPELPIINKEVIKDLAARLKPSLL
jgi:dethiobiotin synthetase